MLALFLLTAALVVACASDPLAQIDAEIAALIEQREQETLGSAEFRDVNHVPRGPAGPTDPDANSYREQPGTANPPPAELPAVTDPSPGLHPSEALGSSQQPAASSLPVLRFNLEDALAYAIEHSRDYRNRKEELFLDALSLLIERHLFSPRFFSTTSAVFSGTPERGDYDQALNLITELGVTQRLPYGGSVTASALVSVTEMLRRASSDSDDGQSADVSLSVTIPLLRGAGQVAREDLIQAERTLIYSARAFERFRRELLVSIATSYFDLLQQQASMRNLEAQIRSLELLAKRFQALADAGREPYFEVERAQQQVLFARNDMLNTRERYEAALDSFKIRIGMPVAQPLEIEPFQIEIPPPLLDLSESVRTASQLRLDLQTSRDQIEDSRRRVAIARNDLLPDLDFFADVDVPTDPARRRGRLDFSAGDGDYSAGFTFDAPLDRRIEQVRLRQAIINLERSQRSASLLSDQIAAEVRNAVRQIEQAQYSLQLQEQNVRLAERRLDGVRLRERELGPRDVIEALDDLVEAQNRRDAAARNLRVSILNYLLATGQMRVSPQGNWLPPARLVPLNPAIVESPPVAPGGDAPDRQGPPGPPDEAAPDQPNAAAPQDATQD